MNRTHPFNSSIECGLRSLVILEHAFPLKYDLQRIVFYDYLLVHSGDAGGPISIHPATPHRSGEVLVKRNMLEQGLLLMMSRNLILRQYDSTGIVYLASDVATPFLDNLRSPYVSLLKERANWVINVFNHYDDKKLEQYFYDNLNRWGGEFEKEALLKYGDI
jgi:hypothetical protein